MDKVKYLRSKTLKRKKTEKEESIKRENSINSDRNINKNLLIDKNEETEIISKNDTAPKMKMKDASTEPKKENFSRDKNKNKDNKEEEYKKKISDLEKEIEKEKNKSKAKTEESSKLIMEYKQKIINCQKEIKSCALKNWKQREKLQSLSKEMDQKIGQINYKTIKKRLMKIRNTDKNECKTEREIVDINIETKQKQLQNIISLIEILQTENEELKNKIKNAQNTKRYFELVEIQKNQENRISELNKAIKIKTLLLKEHSKCASYKSELSKKIESVKDDIKRNQGKFSEIKKRLDFLENKKKEREKHFSKPIIMTSRNNNNNISYRNTSLNLKLHVNTNTESLNHIDLNKIINKDDKKENISTYAGANNNDKKTHYTENENNNQNENKNEDKASDNKILGNETINNINKNEDNNNVLNELINNYNLNNLLKLPKNLKKNFNKINQEEMITIPPNLYKIFSEKELKAILVGLKNSKSKYKNLLRKFNIQNTYIDSLSTKHKLDIKKKLDRINELDEQIEFLNMKKGETLADVEMYRRQIEEISEIKKIYTLKANELSNKCEEKRQILERKNKEIKALSNQLIKLKKLLKNGDMKGIKSEPEIEVQYLDEEDNNDESKQSKKEEKEEEEKEEEREEEKEGEGGEEEREEEREEEGEGEREEEGEREDNKNKTISILEEETSKTQGTRNEENNNENNSKNVKAKNESSKRFKYNDTEDHMSSEINDSSMKSF